MLFNSFLRQFRKYPLFSLINIGGLSIGIAASFVLLVYSQRELSCDRHFKDSDRIARIGTDFYHMGPMAFSQPMLRPLLAATCKDVEVATAIDVDQEVDIRTSRNDRAFPDNNPYRIDSDFFKVFSYEASAGRIPRQGLAPGQVILSEANARRFFGKEDPIGKTLLVGREMEPFTVIAVLHEGFGKSHLRPEILLPRAANAEEASTNWASCSYYNYVKLKPSGSLAGLSAWLDRIREKIVYPSTGTTLSYREWTNASSTVSFFVQSLPSIYFDNNPKFDLSPGGSLLQVKLLGAVAFLLIALAIINYVNLVTARSSIRTKEIGLKKTFGASRGRLVGQLIRESVLFSGVALFFACGGIQVILFCYESSTGSALTGPIPFLSANYFYLIGFAFGVGCIAGIYPAFYLTGERNRLTIRSSGTGKENASIRNGLVIFQFMIATSLVFVSFIVYSQLQYMKTKDKGFQSEGLLVVENAGAFKEQAEAFRQMVAQQAAVVSTSFCTRTPAGNTLVMGTYRNPGTNKNMSIQDFPADDNYIPTMGIHLVSGRNFDKNLLSDTNSLILNESAVAALGLFKPIGALINGSERVIGVVKDFNYASLKEKIGPVILRYNTEKPTLLIRLRGGHTADFINWLRKAGKTFLGDTPLSVSFLDDHFARLAEKERLLGNTISFFTVLAIILATLGLIGLTLFTIERRRKEIGIRKVLGAGNGSILGLLSKHFLRLVLIASAIALPLSWWLVHQWLENFAYRVVVSAWTFLATEALILAITAGIIGLLTGKAIAANPVKALRSE